MITSVQVKAPCRLDIGGTWDIPLLMLSGQQYKPATIGISLDMPTVVTLVTGKGIVIVEDGIARRLRQDQLDFNNIIECIIGYFAITDIKIEIEYNCPQHQGLGGSGSLCVALIQALSEFLSKRENVPLLAHDIEHGHFSITGYQDQLMAANGGIMYYEWKYPFMQIESKRLLSEEHYSEITDRLLIASIGKHVSNGLNVKQVATYCDPKTRPQWVDLNEITKEAAKAIESHDWDSLAQYIAKEHEIRNKLVPERVAGMNEYIKVCAKYGVSWGTPGAGQAAIFAFGDPERITIIKPQWVKLGGQLLSSKIASKGAI